MVKQIQTEKEFEKQEAIMTMMKILIELNHRLVDVDDYILKDYEKVEDHKIKINQEIIISLVRIIGKITG